MNDRISKFAQQFIGGNMGIRIDKKTTFRGIVREVTDAGYASGGYRCFKVVIERPAYNAKRSFIVNSFKSWKPGPGQYLPTNFEAPTWEFN